VQDGLREQAAAMAGTPDTPGRKRRSAAWRGIWIVSVLPIACSSRRRNCARRRERLIRGLRRMPRPKAASAQQAVARELDDFGGENRQCP
jgi:hypothetical protein